MVVEQDMDKTRTKKEIRSWMRDRLGRCGGGGGGSGGDGGGSSLDEARDAGEQIILGGLILWRANVISNHLGNGAGALTSFSDDGSRKLDDFPPDGMVDGESGANQRLSVPADSGAQPDRTGQQASVMSDAVEDSPGHADGPYLSFVVPQETAHLKTPLASERR